MYWDFNTLSARYSNERNSKPSEWNAAARILRCKVIDAWISCIAICFFHLNLSPPCPLSFFLSLIFFSFSLLGMCANFIDRLIAWSMAKTAGTIEYMPTNRFDIVTKSVKSFSMSHFHWWFGENGETFPFSKNALTQMSMISFHIESDLITKSIASSSYSMKRNKNVFHNARAKKFPNRLWNI